MEEKAEDILSKFKCIVEMYHIAKDVSLYSEEIDNSQKMNPQILNELRMGLDHLMRVLAVDLKIKNENDEYVRENINSCFNHIYRVGYDALDWASLTLRSKIYDEINQFSNETIISVIPDYYTKIQPEIEEMHKKISTIRYEKDVGHKNIEGFMDYAEKVKILKGYYEDILKKKPTLVGCEKKLRNEKRGEMIKQFIITGVVAGIVVVLLIKFIEIILK
jgi:hypothetical protein